jgi:hypothetical protein
MKIQQILTESEIVDLNEGPLGNIGKSIARGLGNVASGVAKGAGAAAGGISGMGSAFKKGYKQARGYVSGDDEEPAKASGTQPPTDQEINKAGPVGTPKAKPIKGAVAKQAAAKTAAATSQQDPAQAGETLYSQVKANVEKLDKKGKQRILQLLQKSLQQHGSRTKPDAAPAAEPQAAPAKPVVKKPIKMVAQKKTAAQPQAQTAGYVHNGKLIAEGFSLYRKA